VAAALLVTVGAVALGSLVGALARSGPWLGVLRTFALTGVVAVVLTQLLPEAIAELGLVAVAAFAAALLAPAAIARTFVRISPGATITAAGICVEVGFLGLLAHQLAEGLAIGTTSGPAHAGHEHSGLVLAVAAHTIPLTALLVSATRDARGGSPALRRAVALLLATGAGFGLGAASGEVLPASVHAAGSAVIAGLLGHVLLHDPGLPRRERPLLRTLDVAAALAGAALPVWVALRARTEPGSRAPELRDRLVESFVDLALVTAPMLLLGLALAAAVQLLGDRLATRVAPSTHAAGQALRGMWLAAPRPRSAGRRFALAQLLHRRGAGPALVVAFLLAGPELAPFALAVGVAFFGWPFALIRLAAALALAFAAAILFARLIPAGAAPAREPVEVPELREPPGPAPALLRHFDALLLQVAPWASLGLVAAALVDVALPVGRVASLRPGVDVLVVAAVALPIHLCPTAATPLGAVLAGEGMSVGAILVGLLLAPATSFASRALLSRTFGARASRAGLVGVVVLAVGVSAAIGASGLSLPSGPPAAPAHGPGAIAAAAALAAALLVQLWRCGTGAWLSVLDLGAHAPGHAHEHR
jgi:hypothetical protein